MAKIDTYYRAFREYRKITKEHKDCVADLNMIKNANSNKDILESTRYKVSINEDWVEHIEEGLKFVEKALAEERQFIRSDGEIVPIEKAKKVSRATVEHLAKHSNMITHVPEEGKDLVPDKLYMVEKLSDYAVYENRFLYMLLTYIHEFIMYRLEKIEKMFGTYDGHTEVHKVVEFQDKKVTYDVVISEHRENNKYTLHDHKSSLVIQRIKDCDQIVNSMLNGPLMTQVAKTPMIKPPITKTNVLKMNNNFKNALALYNYLAEYTSLGFEGKEVKNTYHPLKDVNGFEIAECLNATSFVAYKIGNDIEEVLNTNFEAEEEKRKQEEAKKLVERIERLKKKAKDNEQTLEEYMLLLEERNKQLEKDSQELILVKNKVVELNRKIDDLNLEKIELQNEIEHLEEEIVKKEREIDDLNQKYIDDMNHIKQEHQTAMQNLTDDYENKINDIYERHQEEIDGIQQTHQEEIDNLNSLHQNEITDLENSFQEERNSMIAAYSEQIDNLNGEIEQKNKEKEELIKDYDTKMDDLNSALKDQIDERNATVKEYEGKLKALEDHSNEIIGDEQRRNRILKREKDMMRAELNAMRIQQGKVEVGDEFASRQRFDELEEEFMAFNDFFKEQWKYTKKEIRKMILWERKEKKKKVSSPIEDIASKVDPVVQQEVLKKNEVKEQSLQAETIEPPKEVETNLEDEESSDSDEKLN